MLIFDDRVVFSSLAPCLARYAVSDVATDFWTVEQRRDARAENGAILLAVDANAACLLAVAAPYKILCSRLNQSHHTEEQPEGAHLHSLEPSLRAGICAVLFLSLQLFINSKHEGEEKHTATGD